MTKPNRKNPFAVDIPEYPTLYVSGPVTGRESLNVQAFLDARRRLQAAGYNVVIPHMVVNRNAPWLRAMAQCIEAMTRVDGVALLDDWEDSDGAKIEMLLADRGGLPVATVDEWCEMEGEMPA